MSEHDSMVAGGGTVTDWLMANGSFCMMLYSIKASTLSVASFSSTTGHPAKTLYHRNCKQKPTTAK